MSGTKEEQDKQPGDPAPAISLPIATLTQWMHFAGGLPAAQGGELFFAIRNELNAAAANAKGAQAEAP